MIDVISVDGTNCNMVHLLYLYTSGLNIYVMIFLTLLYIFYSPHISLHFLKLPHMPYVFLNVIRLVENKTKSKSPKSLLNSCGFQGSVGLNPRDFSFTG